MNLKMHGRKIKVAYWPDTETEKGRELKSNNYSFLEMSATYHGDRDEFWIVEYNKIEGKFVEVARHNLKYIESFIWAENYSPFDDPIDSHESFGG